MKTIINDNSSDNSDQPQHVKSLLKERSNLLPGEKKAVVLI